MPEPRRNVELKARDADPARTLAVVEELGAEDRGLLVQRDAYFAVPRGRLKLRTERPGGAQLIFYDRVDEPQERTSAYRLVAVPDPAALEAALGAALGIVVIVEKRRRLFLWRSVRIHLDDVAGLGSFVELEAVAPADSDLVAEHALVAELRAVLRIDDERLVAQGYAALLTA